MAGQTPPPAPMDKLTDQLATERTHKVRGAGRALIATGLYGFIATVIAALAIGYAGSQSAAIGRLAGALHAQREQFEACKDKTTTTRGCAQPVAAEPAVVVRQGATGLQGIAGAAGVNGATGAVGPAGMQGPKGDQGPAGPTGAVGPIGPQGIAGVTPGCALLKTACVGATGATGGAGARGPQGEAGAVGTTGDRGAQGEQGTAGAQGDRGPQGETGAAGAAGPKGEQGPSGTAGVDGANGYSVMDQDCLGDGTDSFWRVYLSNGTDQKTVDAQGPCRIGPAPPTTSGGETP